MKIVLTFHTVPLQNERLYRAKNGANGDRGSPCYIEPVKQKGRLEMARPASLRSTCVENVYIYM